MSISSSLLDIPKDLILVIASHLGSSSNLSSFKRVCKKIKEIICKSPLFENYHMSSSSAHDLKNKINELRGSENQEGLLSKLYKDVCRSKSNISFFESLQFPQSFNNASLQEIKGLLINLKEIARALKNFKKNATVGPFNINEFSAQFNQKMLEMIDERLIYHSIHHADQKIRDKCTNLVAFRNLCMHLHRILSCILKNDLKDEDLVKLFSAEFEAELDTLINSIDKYILNLANLLELAEYDNKNKLVGGPYLKALEAAEKQLNLISNRN